MTKYIQELTNGSYREVTAQELNVAKVVGNERKKLIKEKEKIKKLLNAIYDGCTHPVCYDEAGHPYDIRTCVRCGYTSLL